MRVPVDTGSEPITNAAIVRSRFTAYQREPGTASDFFGFAGHTLKPAASRRRAVSRTKARSDLALPINNLNASPKRCTSARSPLLNLGHTAAI